MTQKLGKPALAVTSVIVGVACGASCCLVFVLLCHQVTPEMRSFNCGFVAFMLFHACTVVATLVTAVALVVRNRFLV
jgi:hypothetical protein